jgi:hypothetical protein
MEHVAVVGLEDPRNPRLISMIPFDGNMSYYAEATPDGTYMLAGDGLGTVPSAMHIYDLRNAEVPTRVGLYYATSDVDAGYSIPNVFDISADGSVAVVGWYGQGLQVLDISDPRGVTYGPPEDDTYPAGPRLLASMRFEDSQAYAAELWQERHPGYVFVSDVKRGLDIFHVPALGPGFVSFGSIRSGHEGPSATRTEFEQRCTTAITSQAGDAWVTPVSPVPERSLLKLSSSYLTTDVMTTTFYDAACRPLGGFEGGGPKPMPLDARYAVVSASEGQDLRLEIRAF